MTAFWCLMPHPHILFDLIRRIPSKYDASSGFRFSAFPHFLSPFSSFFVLLLPLCSLFIHLLLLRFLCFLLPITSTQTPSSIYKSITLIPSSSSSLNPLPPPPSPTPHLPPLTSYPSPATPPSAIYPTDAGLSWYPDFPLPYYDKWNLPCARYVQFIAQSSKHIPE